jgi:hypothetical protein
MEFNGALERVLYDGEHSPTTFNLAFLMHTMFRDEIAADAEAVKTDQGGNYARFMPPEGSRPPVPAKGSSRTGIYLAAGALVVAAMFGGMYYMIQQGNQERRMEQKSLQDKLSALQQEKAANDAKLAEIAKQEAAQKSLEQMFGQQAAQGATEAARDTARKDLEAAKVKARDLARQRLEAQKEAEWLEARQKAARTQAATPPPPAPIAAAPAPAPAAAPPAPAPAPAAVLASQPPVVTQKSSPQIPRTGTKDSLPPSLQQADIKVALRVFVDSTGHAQKVVVLRGVEGASGYNESAQSAALASRFSPALKDGKPTSGWLEMEFDFGKPR